MAFYGTLNIDGQAFKVLHCSFGFEQNIEEKITLKPSSKPEGGTIKLVIEAQQGDDKILSWMLSNTMQKTGSIIYYRDSMAISLKTINFNKAMCIGYKEKFDHEDHDNLQISFSITCNSMVINGLTYKNIWD